MRKRLTIVILAMFILVVCTGVASAQGNGNKPFKGQGHPHKAATKANIKGGSLDFIDMEQEWSREAVLEARALGFVNGDENGRFNPNKPLTNLEAIVMLQNAEGVDLEDYELDKDTEEFFADNQKLLKKIPDWGKKYVQIAYENGLILENELKTFNPNQGIKRYEVCLYMARIADDIENLPQNRQEFKDWQEIPERYREVVQNMHKLGLVNGDMDGKFSPNRVVKRCEMAVMLGNLEDIVLHRFADAKVTGTFEAVSDADSDGNYTVTVNKNSREVEVEADADTVIFVDGKKVDDLDDIEKGSLVRILVKDDKAVLIRITTAADEDEDADENDDYVVKGTFNVVSVPDKNGIYTFSVNTYNNKLAEVDADEDTRVYINGELIDDLDELDDVDVDDQIKITVKDGKAAIVKITLED